MLDNRPRNGVRGDKRKNNEVQGACIMSCWHKQNVMPDLFRHLLFIRSYRPRNGVRGDKCKNNEVQRTTTTIAGLSLLFLFTSHYLQTTI